MSFFAFLLLSNPECPRHLNLALSRKGCEDCPRGHICCIFDGEEVCIPPAPRKPGVCPRRHLGHGRCLEFCSNDRDCPFFEKCCFNGCGHECMAGCCPLPETTSMCAGQCPGEQKCCRKSCGHACNEPR
uniref:WAP four-disulfide core domain 2 n=1 Tax=Neolamprologus brichardi TaxID=32507 RepID=A0A3Q4MBJ1_NEOBR